MGENGMTAFALSVEHVRTRRGVTLSKRLNAQLCALAAVVLGLLATAAQAQGNQQAPLLATPGQHGVTDSGAATYSIPLRLPPGAAGMEPRLSLQYSSHSGNGSLGVGWSLGGLSAITRCPRTLASDNARGTVQYDSNDRFCLDGQRLIAVAGADGAANTQYRLERDPFTRVIGRNSAQTNTSYFEVSRRNGELSLYGASTDSRIELPGKTIPSLWALYRQIDVNQNYLEWTYLEDNANGAWYPARVDYTGKLPGGASPTATFATHARVEFVLEARPAADQVTKYHAGSGQRQTQRIKHIKTYTNQNYTSVILDYRLSYDASPSNGASRVTQIQECTGAGACLPGTAVTWGAAGPQANFQLQTPASGAPTISGPGWINNYQHSFNWADADGDGRQDFFTFGGADVFGKFSSSTGLAIAKVMPAGVGAVLHGDFNGDGLSDIAAHTSAGLVVYLSSGNTYVSGWTMTGSAFDQYVSFDCWTDDQCPNPDDYTNSISNYRVLDANGDGRTDILYINKTAGGAGYYSHRPADILELWISTGSSFVKTWTSGPLDTQVAFGPTGSETRTPESPIWIADFDGDGLSDIASFTGDGYVAVYRSTGTGFAHSYYSSFSFYSFSERGDDSDWIVEYYSNGIDADTGRTVDLNGDGKSDIIFASPEGVRSAWLSTGTGFVGFSTPTSFDYHHSGLTHVLNADLNNDGKADFLARDFAGRVSAWVSTGTTLVWRGSTNTGQTNYWDEPNSYSAADVDGDGRSELISFAKNNSQLSVMRINNVPVDVDRVAQIDNGLGGQFRFEYATLSQNGGANLYNKKSIPAYPKQAVQAPYAVVKRSIVAGAGTDSVTNYAYSGLQFELGTGRGLLGFVSVTRAQPQAGRTTVTTFHQNYPLTGLTQSVVTTAANSSGTYVQVKRIDNTHHCKAMANGSPAGSYGNCSLAAGRLYYSYLQQSAEQGSDLNGAALPTVTTTNTYDCAAAATCWGNLSSSTVNTSDGFLKTSSFTYRNDLNRWHFGLPLNATVQSNAPAWSGLGSAPPIQ